MTIPRINLDNRSFDDLMEELRGLIPRHAPEWNNHNLSDPGITLLELFCWVTEGMIYRTNRIPEASRRRFLELLGAQSGGSLAEDSAAAVRLLQAPWRAVTAADFETLVLQKFPQIARVCCRAERVLDAPDPETERAGHLSVIIVPRSDDCSTPEPSQTLLDEVYRFLDERRLITCRHHVVGPHFSDISLSIRIVCTPSVTSETVKERVLTALRVWFAPVVPSGDTGGAAGWQFGHPVHESEVCALIEAVPGVDHLESIVLRRRVEGGWLDCGRMIGIPAHSLLRFVETASEIVVAPLA
jgi:hypothetical protein